MLIIVLKENRQYIGYFSPVAILAKSVLGSTEPTLSYLSCLLLLDFFLLYHVGCNLDV
jgi:hypothetical protein